jgi:hypothetical protein
MTAYPTYTTGTVAVANGDTVVFGTGTAWSGVNARPGDDITIAGHTVVVSDVTDATHLVIYPWSHDDVAPGASYIITKRSPDRFANYQASIDVSTLVSALNKPGFYWFVDEDADAPDPSDGDDGQYARQPASGKEWLKEGGVWVYQGIFGNLTATDTPWDSETIFAAKVIVPFAGKLWRSLQAANVNNQPDLSPPWWALFLAGGDTVYVAYDDSDRPGSDEIVLKFVTPQTVTFYSGMTDSVGNADVGATLEAVFSIRKNGTEFATATFAAAGEGGAQTCTFACAATTAIGPSDRLTMAAPALRDETLSGIGITLVGYR